jgi:hypothetical protein
MIARAVQTTYQACDCLGFTMPSSSILERGDGCSRMDCNGCAQVVQEYLPMDLRP